MDVTSISSTLSIVNNVLLPSDPSIAKMNITNHVQPSQLSAVAYLAGLAASNSRAFPRLVGISVIKEQLPMPGSPTPNKSVIFHLKLKFHLLLPPSVTLLDDCQLLYSFKSIPED